MWSASYRIPRLPVSSSQHTTCSRGTMAKEVTVTIKQILHPKNLATCLSEIVKYVLYTKSQIPLPYDQLVKDKPLQEQTQKAAASLQEDGDRKAPVIYGQAKRLQDRVKKLQQHIACIQSTCLDAGSSIQEMAVILGATLVSPKEVYRVKIASGLVTGSAAVLAQDNLTRYVVRSLVSIGLEANVHSISPTNCFVLFIPRHPSPALQPKLTHLKQLSADLHKTDRVFYYSEFCVFQVN